MARIVPSNRSAEAVQGVYADSAEEVLLASCLPARKQPLEVIRCSLEDEPAGFPERLLPSENGFVFAAVRAYSRHHHLVLRPDDIWFAALGQFSLYVNANSEKLRSRFVAHRGTKELEIVRDGTRFSVDYGEVVDSLGALIEQNVVDPGLREWMAADFSTSTRHDRVVAGLLLMGAVQKYFSYKLTTMCGLPSVTLLGTRADWVHLLRDKIPRFADYGSEAAKFANLLKPVVARMVQSFDTPEAPEVRDFWARMVDERSNGSGRLYYSGWIAAFCFWDELGRCLYKPGISTLRKYRLTMSIGAVADWVISTLCRRQDWEGEPDSSSASPEPSGGLVLDGVSYHMVSTQDVASGWCMMPLKIEDNGVKVDAGIVVGLTAIQVSASGDGTAADGAGEPKLDTLQPRAAYWIYEKRKEDEKEEQQMSDKRRARAFRLGYDGNSAVTGLY